MFTCEIKKEKRKWIAGVHEAFQDACAPSANASASGQGLASGHSVTSGQASSGAACIFHDIADANIPSAEEEDADRRLRHRLAAVQAIRRTPEYSLSRRSLGYARPLTPDPSDLTISKRQWEKGIQRWRWRLRTIRVSSAVSGTPGPRGGGYHRKERAPQQAIVSCGPPVRAMLEDGPSCILSPYGWSGIEQAEVHCLGGEWDAITSELPEKRTDAQEAETYSGETVERSTAPVDHQIPSCDRCGAETYALACEGCGIRFCDFYCGWEGLCACPPGTGRYPR